MDKEAREKPEECDSCRFETKEIKFYKSNHTEKGCWLCYVCAATPAGTAQEYPNQYYQNKAILEMIGFCTNMIIREIRKLKK